MADPVIGIIGGSGLYEIDGLADVEWRRVASPFGETSDEFCFGRLDGQPNTPKIGRDAKWQLNLFDPDGTRAELMEFHAIGKPCCTPFSAADPIRTAITCSVSMRRS